MSIDKGWYLLFAVTAAAVGGVVLGSGMRRDHHRRVQAHRHAGDLKSWENEGGNLAPPPRVATPA